MRIWLLPVLLAAAQLALWPGTVLARGGELPPVRTLLAVALVLGLAAALGLRHRRPVATAAVTAAGVAATGWVLPHQAFLEPGDALLIIALADLVALYNVAVRCPRRTTAAVLTGVLLWQAVVLAGTADHPLSVALAAVVYGLVAAGGRIRRRWLAERSAAARRLAEAERDRRDAAAAERRRLARELHDVTAHHLTSIVVNASAAQYLGDSRPDLRAEALAFAARTGRETLAALRRLVAVLPLGSEEPAGPAPSLADLADDFRQLGQVVTAELTGDPPPAVAEAAYGIAREALTNTLRYAPGAAVRLRFAYGPHGAVLEVVDDGPAGPPALATAGRGAGVAIGGGRAADAGAADGRAAGLDGPGGGRGLGGLGGGRGLGGLGGGRGLGGMRERAAALGGTVLAGPRDGRGWRVRAVLPPPAEGAGPRLRRWLRSQTVLDASVMLLALVLPLASVGLLVEERTASRTATVLAAVAVVVHAAPLLWRRRFPWAVLAAVAATGWLGPLLIGTALLPPDAGAVFVFSAGADLAAVYAVAARGARPPLTWLAPLGATVSGALALAVMVALDRPAGYGTVAMLAVLVAVFTTLTAIVLAPVLALGWLAGFAARRRRQRRFDREQGAVAAAARQAEVRARDERARIAAGLRTAVLEHAARVPRAAEEEDLPGVLRSARDALTAMRALLDGMGTGEEEPADPPAVDPRAGRPGRPRTEGPGSPAGRPAPGRQRAGEPDDVEGVPSSPCG